jgi:predicted esterase
VVTLRTTVATLVEWPERDNGLVGKKAVSRESVAYYGGQLLDVYKPELPWPAAAVVVLWHGSGANERVVLEPLARQIAGAGVRAVVPDWSTEDEANGRNHLSASLAFARNQYAEVESIDQMVLVGWSLGASAGMDLVRSPEVIGGWRPSAFVGISGGFNRSPFSGEEQPELSVDPAIPLVLIHGAADEVVPFGRSSAMYDRLLGQGWNITLRAVQTDHAGAIGTVYDPARQCCVPTDDAGRRETLVTVAAIIADLARAGR